MNFALVARKDGALHMEVPGMCSRCQRQIRRGERVRLIYAGAVTDVDWKDGIGAKPVPVSFIPAAHVNTFLEHENIDHCTEPR